MSKLLNTLASYVPHLILQRLAKNPAPISKPTLEEFPAAVMYADITGFTALTEKLEELPHADQGAGAEAVTQMVNAYFDELINTIDSHGGDVVKFTGDGLLVLWPCSPGPSTQEKMAGLQAVVRRAAYCGLQMQKRLHNYRTADGTPLSMRIGIGAGEVFLIHLGGVFNRWEFLVAGDPIIQTSAAEKKAQPGQVMLSPQAYELIRLYCQGTPQPFPHAGTSEHGLLLEELNDPLPPQPLPAVDLTPELEGALRPYIPAAILTKLDAGQSDWLSELRRLTVLFINLPELDHTNNRALERAQTVVRAIQKAIYREEGSLNKLAVDDKGAMVVAAMGLPPLSHADDPERGARAALAVANTLKEMGIRVSIGVATGQTFCGAIGSAHRREYTMMGDPVNLAARLMQAAQDPATQLNRRAGLVLCDLNTFSDASTALTFEAIRPITVKGKRQPVPVYQPIRIRSRPTETHDEWARTLVGRKEERFSIAEQLQELQRGGTGAVFVIEGEIGIGKSRLAEEVVEQAKALGITTYVGIADVIERDNPYHAWRPVFLKLLEVDAMNTARFEQVARLFNNPELARLYPLMDEVLDTHIEDNEFTRHMEGQVRADNTRQLLVNLFQAACSENPTLLLIEDAQWLDSASWALLHDIWANVKPLLLMITTRPIGDAPSEELAAIIEHPNTRHLQLGSLPKEEIVDLVCRCLGVSRIPEPVAELIYEKAEGHPFYSQELAYALRDNRYLEFTNGACRLAPGVNLEDISFPNTVQGVIINRIDNLPATAQLILKVASVIGRVFPFAPLYDIYPLPSDKPKLQKHLNILGELDITPLASPPPNLSYIFKHIITQEVSYNLLPFAQRQQLHRASAEWYEKKFASDLSPYYTLLAHHWSNAGVPEKAIEYHEKAGEKALRGGAYLEAIHHFEQALFWAARHQPGEEEMLPVTSRRYIPESRFRQARWERQIGQAYIGLGQIPASYEHLKKALALLDRHETTKTLPLIGNIVWQIGKQAFFRLFPSALAAYPEKGRPVVLEAARAFSLASEAHFYLKRNLSLTHAVIRTLNLTERAGATPELARAYANMGMLMGLLPIHWLARFYLQKALDTLDALDHSEPRAYVNLINALYGLGTGDWDGVEKAIQEAIRIYSELGDQRRLGEARSLQAIRLHFLGQYQDSNRVYTELYRLGQQSGDVQVQTWGLDGQATNLIRTGDLAHAGRLLAQAQSLLEQSSDLAEETVYYGTLAVLHLEQGDYQVAAHAAETALEKGRGVSPVYSTLEGHAGAAEVFLRLWELQPDSLEQDYLIDRAGQAVKALQGHARRFPFSRPRALIWQGLHEWLLNRHEKAHTIWKRAIAAAQELHMPYEEALANEQLGRHLPGIDPQRKTHLQRAQEIFERLGVGLG